MTSIAVATSLRQRADYTYKYNRKTARHGWLRLTPAYSVRVVEELLDPVQTSLRVLDPFCGTATTALSAACHGHDAITTDINPFLVWFGRAKTDCYSFEVIKSTRDACTLIIEQIRNKRGKMVEAPAIHNIERWWSATALSFLCHLQQAINDCTEDSSQENTLLKVAFCRTLIACSNAAFNHQSMSFKKTSQEELCFEIDYFDLFESNVDFVLDGAEENPEGKAEIILHDARNLEKLNAEKFDLVITSPPYANRMSYIRELRPYMYWLGFLANARSAGDLDWLAIGGTWGIATSRLTEWQPNYGAYTSTELEEILAKVACPSNANGVLLAKYIHKYCVDMGRHFDGLRQKLANGARVHYIVGNSTFYGELLSVERIYAHMMQEQGFSDVTIRPIRKRNSKKELVEFDVSAYWNP